MSGKKSDILSSYLLLSLSLLDASAVKSGKLNSNMETKELLVNELSKLKQIKIIEPK